MKGFIGENKGRHGARWFVKFRTTFKRFREYDKAERFLTGLRFKSDEGLYDPRDYQRQEPLILEHVADQYLAKKSHLASIRGDRRALFLATDILGSRNIKSLQYGDFDAFLDSISHLSSKTRHDYLASLRRCLRWAWRQYAIKERFEDLEWPRVKVELGWRKVVDRQTQQAILDELERIVSNRRIWVAVWLLAGHPDCRPKELLLTKEKDYDSRNGILFIRHPKECGKSVKDILLLDEEIRVLNSLPPGFPEDFLFRHTHNRGCRKAQRRIHTRNLNWWVHKATEILGIKGVTLYSLVKHSTVTYMNRELGMSPEEIRRFGTRHSSNVAFDRYLIVDEEKRREITARIRAKNENNLQIHRIHS